MTSTDAYGRPRAQRPLNPPVIEYRAAYERALRKGALYAPQAAVFPERQAESQGQLSIGQVLADGVSSQEYSAHVAQAEVEYAAPHSDGGVDEAPLDIEDILYGRAVYEGSAVAESLYEVPRAYRPNSKVARVLDIYGVESPPAPKKTFFGRVTALFRSKPQYRGGPVMKKSFMDRFPKVKLGKRKGHTADKRAGAHV